MYINHFTYQPGDVTCRLCAEYRKGQGCTANFFPWLRERIETGTLGYREAVYETMAQYPALEARLSALMENRCSSLWSNIQHKKRMKDLRNTLGPHRRRDTASYYAAMYLLTANEDIYRRTVKCFVKHGLEFDHAVLRGITLHNYTLFAAARFLYTGSEEITQEELANPEIITPEAFRLIVNAFLIARYGLDAFVFTNIANHDQAEPKT